MLKSAVGDIKTIIYNDKTSLIKRDSHKFLVIYGATGNGKSMVSTLKMLKRIFQARVHEKNFILAGKDITTLEKRFINSDYSVLNWRPFKGKWVYKKQGVGGAKVIFKTRTGDKYLYLTPFNNKDAYSSILGNTLNGVFVDEAVEADDLFLQEIVSRVNRTDGTWAIFTSNGGDPNSFFYTGLVNKCKTVDEHPEFKETFITTNFLEYASLEEKEKYKHLPIIKSAPIEEVRYFDEKRNDNMMFFHLVLEDNPTYTKEQLDNFYDLFPIGSFMYFSRILGVRGFTQTAPFAPYVNDNMFVDTEWLKNNREFYPSQIVYSVDVGSHVFSNVIDPESPYVEGDYGTAKGGHTVMLTMAISKDYKHLVLLDTFFPNRMVEIDNAQRINERIYDKVRSQFPMASSTEMFCDQASPSMIATLRQHVWNVSEIIPCVKRNRELGIDEISAVTLIQQYMMKGRLKILNTEENVKRTKKALIEATQDIKGYLIDNQSWEADIVDALKYIFTSKFVLLVDN